VLRGRLPSPADIAEASRQAHPGWLALATLAQVASLGMFARQQRRLLTAFGVRMSMPRALAITLSRSAIAISLPAGSAISASFAFHQFRAKGASRGVAMAVMVLSGVLSFVGLVVLYLIGGAVSGAIGLSVFLLTLLLTAGVLGGALTLTWRRWHPRPESRIGQILHAAREVKARHWILALLFAIVNWLADLSCLIAVARAFHLTLPMVAIAGTYLAVQVVRQIPITPGGIGVIETGLITGLVGAGASDAPAAAAVLGYRLLSCWLVIPIGLLAWTTLRRRSVAREPGEPDSGSAGGPLRSAGRCLARGRPTARGRSRSAAHPATRRARPRRRQAHWPR
jgi:uncharacterized membrane protein YbhN (UPF0104 family)